MTTSGLLLWMVFAYVAVRLIRYVIGARIYLTCALREGHAKSIDEKMLAAGTVRILSCFDQELAVAGFRHLGYGQCATLLTYYDTPDIFKIFAIESIRAIALVRRSLVPEYGGICTLELVTEFANGRVLSTTNSHSSVTFTPENTQVEDCHGFSVAALLERHAVRVAEEGVRSEALAVANIEVGLDHWSSRLNAVRKQFRARSWTRASADAALDSFTLRGAFALVHHSIRVLTPVNGKAAAPPAEVTEQDRSLRVEAELEAISSIAEAPQRSPGIPWPLIMVIAATVAVSFAAMALLWNAFVAMLILSVIVLHEAGHAIAMRLIGYRDVHVFFVPLLGAMTIGQTTVSSVRHRVLMLLAGPVPGLWLAVALLALDRSLLDAPLVRICGFAALLINGLNLLPITPLDGGRVVELLSRPESAGRLLVHALSIVGLLVLALLLKDPVLIVIAVLWLIALRSQLLSYRLRKAIAVRTQDRADCAAVTRTALEVMLEPAYASWRAVSRQSVARATAKLFGEPIATAGDRLWVIAIYVSGWIPALIALALWGEPL